jgi:hypothetical protein
MSCIISSNCKFIDVEDNLYAYYTLTNYGIVGGDMYNSPDQVASINDSSNYRVKQAFLVNKNDNSILNDIKFDKYNTLAENENMFDITKYTIDAVDFQSAISDFSNDNNNRVKDHKTYYVYVYDGTAFFTYGGSALSQNISELVPNGVKYCALIEYLYDCKGPITTPPVVADQQGCYLNMDVTSLINTLPSNFLDFKDLPISDGSTLTFNTLFNNFDDADTPSNQAKLSFNNIVVYFEETPNCLLNSSSAITIEKFTEYVNNETNDLGVQQVRVCVLNTIKVAFNRVQNYVEKMLLYKKLNTAPDGVFLNDKKNIEKRLGEDNLNRFTSTEGKYNMFFKIAHVIVILAAILMFLIKANKESVKNYIILSLCIFMPYALQLIQFTIKQISNLRNKIL